MNLSLHHVSQCVDAVIVTRPYATGLCHCTSTEDDCLQSPAAGRPLPLRRTVISRDAPGGAGPGCGCKNGPTCRLQAAPRPHHGQRCELGWLTLGLTVTTVPLHDTSHMALCYAVLCCCTRPAQLRPAWLASPQPCCSMCRCLAGLLTFGSRLPRERSVAS